MLASHKQSSPPSPNLPKIRLLTDDSLGPVLLKCDRTAVLSVVVTGLPAPSVRWFIGQRLVRQGPNYGLSSDGCGVHALIIRQVTEEMDGGVFVTARNDEGVISKRIEVKTFRVFSKMNSTDESGPKQSEQNLTSEVLLRPRRLVKDQPTNRNFNEQKSLRSQFTRGFHSSPPFRDAPDAKTSRSTDDVFTQNPVPHFASPVEKKRGEVKLIFSSKTMDNERKKKAYSWVENFVQEIPSSSIKPGIWEQNRFDSLVGGESVHTTDAPIDRRTTAAVGNGARQHSGRSRERNASAVEDDDNEVLWKRYGFKLGRSSTESGEDRTKSCDGLLFSSIAKSSGTNVKSLKTKMPRTQISKQEDFGQVTRTSANDHMNVSGEPLYAIPLKLGNGKSKSSSGLEMLNSVLGARKIDRQWDPNFLVLRTNARTVRCENPLTKPRQLPNTDKRYSLPMSSFVQLHLGPGCKDHDDSHVDVNNSPNPDSVFRSSGYIADRRKTGLGGQLNNSNADDIELGRNLHDFPSSAVASYAMNRSEDHFTEQAQLQQQQQQQQQLGTLNAISKNDERRNNQPDTSDILRRKAYYATVNLRPKTVGGSRHAAKFVVVDIDLDGKGNANTAEVSTADAIIYGRSRPKFQSDHRSTISRSRSADSSVNYLFQRMLSLDSSIDGRRLATATEIL